MLKTISIPIGYFNEIIQCVNEMDFDNLFVFNFAHESESVFDNFEIFKIGTDYNLKKPINDYIIDFTIKADYEIVRGEVVNKVSFSIDEMIVYHLGNEILITDIQAEILNNNINNHSYNC